jgi:hypothetical protein
MSHETIIAALLALAAYAAASKGAAVKVEEAKSSAQKG